MLKLRLQRRGKNKYATYRVVVADKDAPIQGRFIADVGSYNPHTNAFAVDVQVVTDWLAKGVQPSATLHNLLITHKVITGEKVTIWHPPKAEGAAPAPAAAEAAAEAPAETKADEAPAEQKAEEKSE